ncbi:MAG: hypothetical protein R2757_18595 [Draconibacterium sp.]|jgi:Mn2+/Fe2+ NRAMP family transporter
MNKKQIWRLCVTAVILIIILTFSPLVTGKGKIEPFLLGLPFTLWMGILLTIALVAITYIGGSVLPDEEEEQP